MNKNKIVILNILLLIALILILIAFMLTIFAKASGENEATDFTFASVDSVPIISNNKDLAKANFTLTLIANGGGQSVVGNFGNETFSDILKNKYKQYVKGQSFHLLILLNLLWR